MMGGCVEESSIDPEVRNIAKEIRNYLVSNPDAAESLPGIVRWWLVRQRFETAWYRVEAALDYLTAKGLVQKTTGPGGETIYSGTQNKDDRVVDK